MSDNFVLSDSGDSDSDDPEAPETSVEDACMHACMHSDDDSAMSLRSTSPRSKVGPQEEDDLEHLFEPIVNIEYSEPRRALAEAYAPAARKRHYAEAQVPGSTAVWTSQQLNSSKQNVRRAKETAAKAQQGQSSSSASGQRAVPQPGRILEAGADFWTRKKPRLAAKGDG